MEPVRATSAGVWQSRECIISYPRCYTVEFVRTTANVLEAAESIHNSASPEFLRPNRRAVNDIIVGRDSVILDIQTLK